jgi:DNA primase
LMNHPFLLNEHVEDIANARFRDRELDSLLHEILRIHALMPDLDGGTLKFHLTENGFGAAVNRVLSPQVLKHVAPARPQADPEIVREAWSELARQIELRDEARDMAAAERDLATDLSVETWTRHRQLFERKQRG